jgi:hypothetical protein
MEDVAAALTQRRGDPSALEHCLMGSRTALGVFGAATEQWATSNAEDDFGQLIDRGFEMIDRMLSR